MPKEVLNSTVLNCSLWKARTTKLELQFLVLLFLWVKWENKLILGKAAFLFFKKRFSPDPSCGIAPYAVLMASTSKTTVLNPGKKIPQKADS